jgi:hypothetical protein
MRLPSDFAQSEQLILHAVENGVNYFDTAYIYPGKEALLGKIVHKNNLRERVKIATKLPLVLVKSGEDFDKFFDKQLARLQTDYIDYYMLHMLVNPAQLQSLFDMGLQDWVEKKKQSGQIRKFGFSFHGGPSDFIKIIDFCPERSGQDRQCLFDFVMIQYNYLDINCQAGIGGLRHAYSKGIPVIAMEPLRGGTLANPKRIPKKAMRLFEQTQYSPAQWAMSWLFAHREITCVLSGMRNMFELQDNLSVANGETAPKGFGIIEQVTAIFREQNTIGCTGCNYCVFRPDGGAICPVGVNIPGCFMAYNAKSIREYAMSTGAVISKAGMAGSCIKCGKCEPLCPQAIPIMESLAKVSKKMEPFWLKGVFSLARKFTNRKDKKS